MWRGICLLQSSGYAQTSRPQPGPLPVQSGLPQLLSQLPIHVRQQLSPPSITSSMPAPLATVPRTAAHTFTSHTGEARHCSAGSATSGAQTSGSTNYTFAPTYHIHDQSSRLSGAENTWLSVHVMQTDSAAASNAGSGWQLAITTTAGAGSSVCEEVGLVSRPHLLFGGVRSVATVLKVVEEEQEGLHEIEGE